MALFNPVDMMGPAHRGPQIQALAQTAAANVMRRNKLKALLAQGARGARAAGAGQPMRNSMNARAIHSRTSTLHGLASSLAGPGTKFQAMDPHFSDDGEYGAAGGGYDYPSIPDASDPSQSPVGAAQYAQVPPPPAQWGQPNQHIDTDSVQAQIDAAQPGATGGDGGWGAPGTDVVSNSAGSPNLIHLGNGMYYDPVTDAVRGGGGGVKPPMGRLR